MERNQAISVAVGVGAVGTALAYLGYSYYNKKTDTANLVEEPKQQTAWWNNLFENSNTIVEEVDSATVGNNESSDVNNKSATINNDSTVNTVEKASAWGQFWKGEYGEKNEKIETKED